MYQLIFAGIWGSWLPHLPFLIKMHFVVYFVRQVNIGLLISLPPYKGPENMLKKIMAFVHAEFICTAESEERIAWIDYCRGDRFLYIASAPFFKPELVARFRSVDKVHITNLQLSPSGNYLCYNRREQFIDGSSRHSLIVTDLRGNEKNTCHFPPARHFVFTGDDRRIFYIPYAFPDKVEVICMKTARSKTLLTSQGNISDLSWSEEASSLSWVVTKVSRSFVAVYHVPTKSVQWVSPHLSLDQTPVWSPSGEMIAFIRHHNTLHKEREVLPGSDLSAFSVMLFDCRSKVTQTLWDSRNGMITSRSSQEGFRPLSWLNDRELVFSHEGSGWESAYSLNIVSRLCQPLSEGDYLVRDISVCPASETVYLSHNKMARHCYQITGVQGQNMVNIPVDENSYSMNFSPRVLGKGRYVAFLNTSATTACRLRIFDRKSNKVLMLSGAPLSGVASEKQIKDSVQADTVSKTAVVEAADNKNIAGINAAQGFKAPSMHILKTRDNKTCYGQLFSPEGEGPHPAVLYLHDGPGQQSLPAFHPSLEMSFNYAVCQYLAGQGFAVLDLNYRGSGGYNKSFREAKERGWQGASEYFDVLAAGKWLQRRSNIKKEQIGIIGKGWGGYLAALGLARDSQLFHAGIDIHGYHHFPRIMRAIGAEDTSFSCMRAELATTHIAQSKLAVEFSPWGNIDDWMSPVLIVHGDDNLQVPLAESQQLYHALLKRGVQAEALVIPGETHTFTQHGTWLSVLESITVFLRKYLLSRS